MKISIAQVSDYRQPLGFLLQLHNKLKLSFLPRIEMATSRSPLDGLSNEQVAALIKEDKMFLLKHDANQIWETVFERMQYEMGYRIHDRTASRRYRVLLSELSLNSAGDTPSTADCNLSMFDDKAVHQDLALLMFAFLRQINPFLLLHVRNSGR
jgi:hypothetical protein